MVHCAKAQEGYANYVIVLKAGFNLRTKRNSSSSFNARDHNPIVAEAISRFLPL